MISEDDLQIINYKENTSKEYKINSTQEISKDNMKLLLEKPFDDKIIVNIKLRDDYIIIISVKIKNQLELENSNSKDIILKGLSINIIKLKNNNQNLKININIPMKEEKNITKKNFFEQKYYFYDFISLDESRNYLIIYISNQLHIFKICQKGDLLIYNKIKIKNFENNIKVIYLGIKLSLNENILEIVLLLKPNNNFTFMPIDISDKNNKLEEIECQIDKEKYKNILNKFRRSNCCDKFLFFDKETNQKYLIYKDDNKKEMIVKELMLNNIWENTNTNEKENFHIFNIEDKMLMIAKIPFNKIDKNNNYNFINFGIYSIFYNKENEKFNVELNKLIKIKNEGGIKEDININTNLSNYIYINLNETLYSIHLDQKGEIDIINKFKLNLKSLEIEKNYFEKLNEMNLFLFFIKNNIFISKISDEFNKLGKYIINYGKNNINNINKEKKVNNLENKKKEDNNKKEEKEVKTDGIKSKNVINIDMEQMIEKIIKDRIKMNNKKLDKLIKENNQKYKMIEKEIKKQDEETKILEKKCNDLLKSIKKLNELYNNDDNDNFNEEKNMKNNNYNNRNFNLINNKNQNQNQINLMNNPQISNYQQLNKQQILGQYKIINPNLYFLNNNQIPMNYPRDIQLLHNQQQGNILNGNFFLQNNINKNMNSFN